MAAAAGARADRHRRDRTARRLRAEGRAQVSVTANALDAAAIAILFATFFAAHALWDLIPALVTFGLLAAVTALAVLLSIRRESLFIAVLGLLGGFATPALLSTGENRPIPLFAYLCCSTSASRGWRIAGLADAHGPHAHPHDHLSVGWVGKFLTRQRSLVGDGHLRRLSRPQHRRSAVAGAASCGLAPAEGQSVEWTAIIGAALPLVFVVIPRRRPGLRLASTLLFGFLLLLRLVCS